MTDSKCHLTLSAQAKEVGTYVSLAIQTYDYMARQEVIETDNR